MKAILRSRLLLCLLRILAGQDRLRAIRQIRPRGGSNIPRVCPTYNMLTGFRAIRSSSIKFLQHDPPKSHESNWLPAASSNFILWLRVYVPGEAILSCQYTEPQKLFADPIALQSASGSNSITVGMNRDTLYIVGGSTSKSVLAFFVD